MNLALRPQNDTLARALLDRLARFTRPPTQGVHAYAGQLFSYCALDRERLAQVALPHPLLGIVLRGSKEIWLGERGETMTPGTLFVLPRRVTLDIVNIPDERSGLYESLIFEIDALPAGIAPIPAGGAVPVPRFRIGLTADLVEAVGHAATAIADSAMRADLKALRLAEVLSHLRGAPEARHLFETALTEAVAWRLAAAPDRDWTARAMAAELGLGASTLRRRLAGEGQGFRALLAHARMQAAAQAIAGGATSLAAAEAAGYRSRSHFAARYRAAHGTSPSGRAHPSDVSSG